MKIATLNIDWARKKNPKKTAAFLNGFAFDFLILTEAVDLDLDRFPYKYSCSPIPENTVYENLNYTEYLKGGKAFRTILYSKIACSKKYPVTDDRTNLALEFETAFGNIVFYCTIIGTWFKRRPFADNELQNTISDCRRIYAENPSLFMVGDFNTSFKTGEERLSISSKTTESLKDLFRDLKLKNGTSEIEETIDHIVIPEIFAGCRIETGIFAEKNLISDHQGDFYFHFIIVKSMGRNTEIYTFNKEKAKQNLLPFISNKVLTKQSFIQFLNEREKEYGSVLGTSADQLAFVISEDINYVSPHNFLELMLFS